MGAPNFRQTCFAVRGVWGRTVTSPAKPYLGTLTDGGVHQGRAISEKSLKYTEKYQISFHLCGVHSQGITVSPGAQVKGLKGHPDKLSIGPIITI